jgi:cephalosporin-C deacetylase
MPSSPTPLAHPFPFDPAHGFKPEDLLAVQPPPDPPGFDDFWRARHARAQGFSPALLENKPAGRDALGRRIHHLRYTTTDGLALRAWLVLPADGEPERGLVIGHGYGVDGRLESPGPFRRTALLLPFVRGLARSACADIPSAVDRHVLHGIERPETYVIGGCVEDIWTSVTLLQALYPGLTGRIGYLGTSLGGGLGALALARETRVDRAAFVVPTFGHQPLRMRLPTVGSGSSVQSRLRTEPDLLARTLAYYDSACAARRITLPAFCACALFDPAVAPAGQFAIYNGLAGQKRLHILRAGHFDYPGSAAEHEILTRELLDFFGEA